MATVAVLPPPPQFSSASGILALLDEESHDLKAHALKKLILIVDQFWAEIADSVPYIESLSEDESFPHNQLAAAVASRCFFHLEEYGEALRLALSAGPYFDISSKCEYVQTLIAKCIDEYTQHRINDGDSGKVDQRMESIVERMFEKCYNEGAFSQALGIALETRRLDKVEECFMRSNDIPGILAYSFNVCRTIISNRVFRLEVIKVMVKAYCTLSNPDYSSICQCYQMLDDYQSVATILEKLINNTVDDALMAYQVAFDLSDNENQKFLRNVLNALTPTEPNEEGSGDEISKRLTQLKEILSGQFSVDLILDFLYRQNKTDLLILKNIKNAVGDRNSVLHNATVVAHAYMNCGTTVDTFLRDNLDWMGRAANWAKFTATAGIGVVHKGHAKESMNLLQPYLPHGGVSVSPYSEGGALYALGLIHANNGGSGTGDVISYLRNALKNSGTDEVVQHGACLGIGLAAMASHDMEIFEELKSTLFTDAAVAGEAAGLAIGLVMLGVGATTESSSSAINELLAYAHDTKHEKIIRGAIMGLALMMYGQEEEADPLIEQLNRDKDPIVRYGAMYAIALAYCGTANNSAIRRLLHVAVSDVSDDVRRAAVTCLGFVLFQSPSQVPKLVSLLAESFSPHVRYGACMAVGIACAGSALPEAISLLEPMMDDATDYVRQGAMIALAMVLIQETETRNPKVKAIRERFSKIIADKHQSTMTKMGAILAQGIIDAGGRNVVISLQSHNGFTKMSAAVGLAIWAQHWFWYPLMHFLGLAFQPSTAIGLNKDLKMPKSFSLCCNARPSLFAYPKPLEEKKEEKKERVITAILSTTARAKSRQAKQDAKEKKADKKASDKEALAEGDAMEVDTEIEEKKTAKEDEAAAKKVSKEPSSFNLENPSRVTREQEPFLSFNMNQRYIPIRQRGRPAGIILLKDTKPDEVEDVIVVEAPSSQSEEAEAPQPFEWEPPKENK